MEMRRTADKVTARMLKFILSVMCLAYSDHPLSTIHASHLPTLLWPSSVPAMLDKENIL